MHDTSQDTPTTASIKFLTGSLAGTIIPLHKSVMTIGRDAGNDIVISNDASVAPYQARLLWQQGNWNIEKHPQAEHVAVNQQQVQHAPLRDASVIELGTEVHFLFTELSSITELLPGAGVSEGAERDSSSALISSSEQTLLSAAQPLKSTLNFS